eukprot:TRINITY_DN19802_c0_g2_i1.p1 TRINITY_DN19802_c0_g2~~TRINITY_DN19802_c0_g2_i1.p1  ORF type:complete len:606 (+),score=110.23 TRINITY_DN19802_c0_g2_i1:72-1820(+)
MPAPTSPENAALMEGQEKNARDVAIIGSEGPNQASMFTHPSWWLAVLGLVSAVAMITTLGALMFSSSGGHFGTGSKSFLQFDDELQAAPLALPWMATTWTTKGVDAKAKSHVIEVKITSGLVEGMSIKIFNQTGTTSEEGKIESIDRNKVTLVDPLQNTYSKKAVVTAGNRTWVSLGSNTACRIDPSDSTLSGHGSAQTYTGMPNLEACKHLCEQNIACTGVEFKSSTGYCDVWTTAIGYTVLKPGFECWRHIGYVCDEDLLNSQLMWPTRKKIWCCYQEDKGCSNANQEPDYSAGDGWKWSLKTNYSDLPFVYWEREEYDCNKLDTCSQKWSVEQQRWCLETKETYCFETTPPEEKNKYWQEADEHGFSFWRSTTEGYYWKQVDGSWRQVAFDCNADLDRFQRVWTSEQQRWCCLHFQMGCSDQKPTYDAGDGKYWAWEKVKGMGMWKPAKVLYDCDAYLEHFDLMWGSDQKSWCCREFEKGCSDLHKPPKYLAGNGFSWSWSEGEGDEGTWEREEQKFDCSKDSGTFDEDQQQWCCRHKQKGCIVQPKDNFPQEHAAPEGSQWIQVQRKDDKWVWDLTDV